VVRSRSTSRLSVPQDSTGRDLETCRPVDRQSVVGKLRPDTTDAAVIDEALQALPARDRSAKVDATCAAYDEHPLDEPDEWGDLASFRTAAARA
jgi:hypothetical protein